MSQTKTATKEHLKSPDRDLQPTKLRSPSPPAPPSRATSQVPQSPKTRLTSPVPDSASRATPAPDASNASTPAPPSKEAPPEADLGDDDIDTENVIDLETFTQLLDLDEDDTHDFSLGMTEAYFSQASTTFTDMDQAFESKDLPKLSSLGHFLKGSSAALGVSAVQATCEHIQHYGALRDELNNADLTEQAALDKIAPLLSRVKREYAVAEKWLQDWYKEHATPAED